MKTFLKFALLSFFLVSRPAFPSDLLVTSEISKNVLRYDGRTGAFMGVFIPPASGGLDDPDGIVFGTDQNLYILDLTLTQILQFNGQNGSFIGVFGPVGVFGDDLKLGSDGNFYAPDNNSNIILKITPQGAGSTFATGFDSIGGFTFGPDGNLYAASFNDDSILRFDGTTGTFIDVFVTSGLGGLSGPNGVAFGPDGNLYVASGDTNSVIRYSGTDGSLIGDFIPSGANGLADPFGILFRSDGNLYVAGANSDDVQRYNATTGVFVDAFVSAGSGGLDAPLNMAVFPAGELNFSASAFSVAENAGSATVQINRTKGSSGPVTVKFSTSNGTAIAGKDYTDSSQTVSFTDGQTSQTVSIPILDNGSASGNKTVNLSLSNPTDDATLGGIASAVLTIQDNDNGGGCHLGGNNGHAGAWAGIFIFTASLALLRQRLKNH
jgi:streptogramin lyase